MKQRLRGKSLLRSRPLSVSLLLLSLVVLLHSVSSLDKSFDEESAFGQKRSSVYKEGGKQNPFVNPHGSECGNPDVKPKVDSRIVGGVEAKPNSWPWQVLIKTLIGNEWLPVCGGSVLYQHWVITAAHCVEYGGPADYKIFLGKHNISTYEGNQQVFKLKNLIMHEDYNRTTYENDIALIRLSEDVQFNRYVKPICLPDDDVKNGTCCVATGWGKTQTTGNENVLNQVYLPVISNSQCNKPDWYGGRIKDTMICAGYPEGHLSVCKGDSGGPLACLSEGKWKLFGLASWLIRNETTKLCGMPRRPTVFTRVKSYTEWIRKKTERYE